MSSDEAGCAKHELTLLLLHACSSMPIVQITRIVVASSRAVERRRRQDPCSGTLAIVGVDGTTSRKGRLQSIDLLRGLAVLWIMLLHIPHRADNWGAPTNLRYWLMLPVEYAGDGVVLFIVLSGFCIHGSRLSHAERTSSPLTGSWREFWKRRFIRLYPTYVVALAVGLAVWVYVTNLDYVESNFFPSDLLQHLTMTHNLTPDHAFTLNGPAWTLGMEEQLYLLYMVVLWVRLRRPIVMAAAVSFVTTMGWYVVTAYSPSTWRMGPITLGNFGVWPFLYWFAWVLGSVAAEAYYGRLRLPPWCSRWWVMVFFFAVSTVDHPFIWPHLTNHPSASSSVLDLLGVTAKGLSIAIGWIETTLLAVASALPWFVAVNLLVARESTSGRSSRRPLRALAWLGMISYSLYLTHVYTIQVVEKLTDGRYKTNASRVAMRYPTMVIAMILVGWVFFRVVERRFLFMRARHVPSDGLGQTTASKPAPHVTDGRDPDDEIDDPLRTVGDEVLDRNVGRVPSRVVVFDEGDGVSQRLRR